MVIEMVCDRTFQAGYMRLRRLAVVAEEILGASRRVLMNGYGTGQRYEAVSR